jgi:hypothetical protein
MTEIRLPLTITYETRGATPIGDVIQALRATEEFARDTAALLPSFINGLHVESSELNVRTLSQESPLREYFLLALILTYQDDLEQEVPAVLENLFKITVSEKYDTLATVLFLTVMYYGAGLAIDAARKMVAPSLPRGKFEELADVLCKQTGKSRDEVLAIIKAFYEKPLAARRLVTHAKRILLPSQRDGNAPVVIGSERLESDMVREFPMISSLDKKSDFDRYAPHYGVALELHAMDKDKTSTGWAAVAQGISDKRLKAKVIEPVLASDLWGKNSVIADIIVVSKLTSNGYVPAEIQVTRIISGD